MASGGSSVMTYVAIDKSGSTGGRVVYFDTLSKFIKERGYFDNECVVFLGWDSTATVWTQEDVKQFIRERKGNAGTDPSVIVPILPQREPFDLVIVTDGGIGQGEIDKTDLAIKRWAGHFNTVEILIIPIYDVLPSVGVPFAPLAPLFVAKMTHDGTRMKYDVLQQVSPSAFRAVSNFASIETIAAFVELAPGISEGIVAKAIGRGPNVGLHDELVKMRGRLIGQIKRAAVGVEFAAVEDARTIAAVLAIVQSAKGDAESPEWLNTLNGLISLSAADMRGIYDPRRVRESARQRRADVAAAPEPIEPIVPTDDQYVCDILFTEQNPGLFINICPELHELRAMLLSDFEINNPLRLFNNKEFCDKLSQVIGHDVGDQSLHELLTRVRAASTALHAQPLVDPFTRRPVIHTSFPLSHVHTEQTLRAARMLTGGKVVGNGTLIVIAFLLHIARIERYEHLKPIIADHIVHLLRTKTANITLGNAETAMKLGIAKRAPLMHCIWFVVHSILDQELIEVAAAHLDVYETFVILLQHVGLGVHPDAASAWMRLRAISCIRNKKIHGSHDEQAELDVQIYGLTRRTIAARNLSFPTPSLIQIEGAADPAVAATIHAQLPEWMRGANAHELTHLWQAITANAAMSTLFPLVHARVEPTPIGPSVFVYEAIAARNGCEIQHTIAPIDPRIMRPYKKVSRKNAVLVEEDVPWQIVAGELFAPAQFNISLNAPPPTAQYQLRSPSDEEDFKRKVSAYKLYLDYTMTHGYFPANEIELLAFVRDMMIRGEPTNARALPYCVLEFCRKVIVEFAAVMSEHNIDLAEFKVCANRLS